MPAPAQVTIERKYIDVPFDIKAEDIQEDGVFLGYGSLFDQEPDAYRDIVARGAFMDTLAKGGRNKTGIMMGWNHRFDHVPLGVWLELREDPKGLFVKGQLNLDTQLGKEVYSVMKLGAKTGMWRFSLSIGYDSLQEEEKIIKVGDADIKVRLLKKVELWEISVVNFPAKLGATITSIKKLDINRIKEAKTERELESALREVEGLSGDSAKLLVKMCKSYLREVGEEGAKEEEAKMLSLILDSLTTTNVELENQRKSVIPFKSYPLADEGEKWDGSVEVRESEVSDLKTICTWYDKEAADKKGAYKLPHHKKDGYKTVWRGVAAAMARLLQQGTQIPNAERKGCYNHLAKHYKEFDKPVPDFKDYSDAEWSETFADQAQDVVSGEILESLQLLNFNFN